MSRYDKEAIKPPPLGPDISDSEFVIGYFQPFVAAAMSGFAAPTRSPQAAAGLLWSKELPAGAGYSLMFFDGDNDRQWGKWTSANGMEVFASQVGNVTGDVVAYSSGGYLRAPGANWFLSEDTGGAIRIATNNRLQLNWGNALYYTVDDAGTWYLLHTPPSDENLKELLDVPEGDPLAGIDPIYYHGLPDIPLHIPEGQRWGFSAQNLQSVDPALVRELETPKPVGADPQEELEESTFLALSTDADFQLLARTVRALQLLQSKVAQLEAEIAELKAGNTA
jgi:hypothetical protein